MSPTINRPLGGINTSLARRRILVRATNIDLAAQRIDIGSFLIATDKASVYESVDTALTCLERTFSDIDWLLSATV